MIQFLQPIWLWAISAVAVPLFIHLWNIRQGKTLKVGSIAFLTESTRAHARSLRLSELLLLLLRCLLLILIALLLSKPVWIRQSGGSAEKGWILIGPQQFNKTYTHFKPVVDSLLNNGFVLHNFHPPYNIISVTDSAASTQTGNNNYWAAVQELNQNLPSSIPVHLFTDNNANGFTGNRPNVSLNINWHVYASPDSAAYREYAFRTIQDSTRIITAHNRADGNSYSYKNLSSSADTGTVDTSAIRLCIYTDAHAGDAAYLKAACNAIRDFTQRKIITISASDISQIPGNTDWLFWLSEKPVPENIQAKQSFIYGSGKMGSVASGIITGSSAYNIQVQKLVQSSYKMLPVWTTGNGNILLGKDIQQNHYTFFSRFNPQWNGMAWSHHFPEIIYSLIQVSKEPQHKPRIDAKQAAPSVIAEDLLLQKEALQRQSDISNWFWIIACIIFLAERLYTHYSKRAI